MSRCKGLMTQSFDSDNMDETVDHQGRNICEEHSPKFDRANKQEGVENKYMAKHLATSSVTCNDFCNFTLVYVIVPSQVFNVFACLCLQSTES